MAKRKVNMVLTVILTSISILVIFIWAFINFAPQFGAAAKGERLARMQKSPNYKDGKFLNLEPTPMSPPDSSAFKTMREFLKKNQGRGP